MTTEGELRATLARDLDDVDAWSLYSDYLQARGDVRGELIAIDLALEKERAKERRGPLEERRAALLREHAPSLLGPTFSRVVADHYGSVWWRRGFIDRLGYVGDQSLPHPRAVGWFVALMLREPDAFIFLRSLTFRQTDLADLRPLTAFGQLTELDVALTRVTDPAPLAEMPRLESVDLTGCQIADEKLKALKKARPSLEVELGA